MNNSTKKPEEDNPTTDYFASHYALHVALQTMKERCQSLQQRLVTVEEENMKLRLKVELSAPSQIPSHDKNATQNEVSLLTEKVSELTRQKFQLAEHIAMVATENRQLWSRLSKLTKDNQQLGATLNKNKSAVVNTPANQNLIRSKTFTQNSPNPILRLKMDLGNVEDEPVREGEPNQLSLEEISLKVLNEFLEGKAEFEKKISEILSKPAGSNSFGFAYLNDESAVMVDNELQADIKKCSDGMVDIRKELLRQQSDIKVAISSLRQRRILEICPTCKDSCTKGSTSQKKRITADKKLETDDIISNRYEDSSLGPNNSTVPMMQKSDFSQIDFVEQKRKADSVDKMCPMCARIYSGVTPFEEFQDHVESHFIDDSELDISIEKNFEFVSRAVGNF